MRKQVLRLAMVLMIGLVCGTGWANMIQNGDFETPSPANWTLYNASTGGNGAYETSCGNPGAYVRLWSPGERSGSGENKLYWSQGVTVTPDTEYTLSFDYKTSGDYNYARVNYWGGPGASNWIGLVEIADYWAWGFAPSLTNTDTWTEKTKTFTTPAGCNYVEVLFVQNTGWGSYLSVDNASLVPEPATMGLLAVGGLGALLRRRR